MEPPIAAYTKDLDRHLKDILNLEPTVSSSDDACESVEHKGRLTSAQMRLEGFDEDFFHKEAIRNILQGLSSGLSECLSEEDVKGKENRLVEAENRVQALDTKNIKKDVVECCQATLTRQQVVMKKAEEINSLMGIMKEKENKISETEEKNSQLHTEINSLHQVTEACCKNIAISENEIPRIRCELKLAEKSNARVMEVVPWISWYVDVLNRCGGIRINNIMGSLLTVTVLKHSNSALEQRQEVNEEGIRVVLGFELKKCQPSLTSVQILSDACSWDTVINTAIQSNDVVWLLSEIDRRYHSAVHLKEEIDALQQRYALDWQPDINIVTVMIPGTKEATICKMKLNSIYPFFISEIQIIDIDGPRKDEVRKRVIQLQERNITSLQTWLENIHRC